MYEDRTNVKSPVRHDPAIRASSVVVRRIFIAFLSLIIVASAAVSIAMTSDEQSRPEPTQARTDPPSTPAPEVAAEATSAPTPAHAEPAKTPVHVENKTERHVISGSGAVGTESGAVQHGETAGGSHYDVVTPRPRTTPSSSTAGS
jgi:hypothetical protein